MRLNNTLLASQRRKRLEAVEEKTTEAVKFSHKKAKDEIDELKALLNKQKVDSEVARSRQRINEKRLRDLVSERDEKIQTLHNELDLKSSEAKKLKEEVISLQKRFREKKDKRKSRTEQYSKKESLSDSKLPSELVDGQLASPSAKIEPINEDLDVLNKEISSGNNERDSTNSDHINACPTVVSSNEDSSTSMIEEKNIPLESFIDEPTNLWLKRLDSQIAERNSKVTKASSTPITPTHNKQYDPKKYQGTPQPLNINDLVTKIGTTKNQGSLFQKDEGCHPNHLQGEKEYQNNDEKKQMVGSSDAIKGNSKKATEFQITGINAKAEDKNNIEQYCLDGRRIISYQNGTKKEILPDGTIIVRFTNGDIKTSYKKVGITVYYYSEAKVSNTMI